MARAPRIVLPADSEDVLRAAPVVERCYERLHRKVQPDAYLLAAKGQPSLLWFTLVGGKEVCFLGQWGRGRGCSWRPVLAAFSDKLSAGTLLRGTMVASPDKRTFACEDVLQYRGKHVMRAPLCDKVCLLAALFREDLARAPPPPPFLVTRLPVWASSPVEAAELAPRLPYPLYRVRAFSSATRGLQEITCDVPQRPVSRQIVLEVRARTQNDVYELLCADGSLVGAAAVPSYARSVQLNKIFRNIRENDNLDLLEESEDEDTFQCAEPDCYVDLGKAVRMVCKRVPRYSRLEPVAIAADTAPLASRAEYAAALSGRAGRGGSARKS